MPIQNKGISSFLWSARTTDPNQPNGYSRLYGVILNNETVTGQDKGIPAQEWTGHQSVGDEQLQCTSLASLGAGFWGKCVISLFVFSLFIINMSL